MATTAQFGKFATFSVTMGTGSVAIPQITTLTIPDVTRQKIDTTVLESNATEYVMGGVENGDASFTVIYDPKNPVHQYLVSETNAATASFKVFEFKFNGHTGSIGFTGSLYSFKPDAITNKGISQAVFTVTPSNGIIVTN